MTPHNLVYGVKPDANSWFPIFSVGYFQHKKEGVVTYSATKSQTLTLIAIDRATNSNAMHFYNTVTRRFYTNRDYKLDPGRHMNTHFSLTYNGGIFVVTYISYS